MAQAAGIYWHYDDHGVSRKNTVVFQTHPDHVAPHEAVGAVGAAVLQVLTRFGYNVEIVTESDSIAILGADHNDRRLPGLSVQVNVTNPAPGRIKVNQPRRP